MGFNMLLYIIFGTNLLTGGPVPVAVFCLFQCFEGKGYQMESKRNENFTRILLGTNTIQETLSGSQRRHEASTRQAGAPRGVGASPPSWAPRSSTDLLLSPIYTLIPWKHLGDPRNHFSTTATFCTREIPSWGLFRRSAGRGIDHGGLLHQHHSLSDDVWVVYHRPSGS